MKNRYIPALLIITVLVLAGCEAGKGLGKDIENTGENVQDAVNKAD